MADRLLPALNTWLCDVDAVLLFEDDAESRALVEGCCSRHPTASCRPMESHHTPSPCLYDQQEDCVRVPAIHGLYKSVNGAWKDFHTAALPYTLFPRKQWYAVVDDDSWILHENLNILLSTRYATTTMNPWPTM